MASVQKGALQKIQASGTTAGIQERTLTALTRKGHLKLDEAGKPVLTKRGLAFVEGRMGGNLPQIKKADLRAHFKSRKPKKAPKAKGQAAKERKAAESDLEKHIRSHQALTDRALLRILGPSGEASAIKVSRADGKPFKAKDVEAFRTAGWTVAAAGTVAGRVGAGGLAGVIFRDDDFIFRNPDTLGPTGLARALVIMGNVNREVVLALAAEGLDIAAAPKKLREAPVKNPSPGDHRKQPKVQADLYRVMVAAAKKGQALRVDELANRLMKPRQIIEDHIGRLMAAGLAHVAGRDLFGECFAPGVQQEGLFKNPSPTAKAMAKASAWYRHPDLITGAKELRSYEAPEAAIEAGRIVAIEYESDKFDGVSRIYRHEVVGKKRLFISTDGGTLIVSPPFRITTRGIEG